MSVDITKEVFLDDSTIVLIQKKLPQLFYVAEKENSRAGKVGMEVGSLRERILVSLLLSKFGYEDIETEIPITKAEIDVIVSKNPISIKTFTGIGASALKLFWTSDMEKVKKFVDSYYPSCDMIVAQIKWGREGGLYFFTKELQQIVYDDLGSEYIKLPKAGVSSKGVEISKKAVKSLMDATPFKIMIRWYCEKIEYNAFERWIELWKD